ncbi:hypothetical protein [Streptomyces luteireticuli]|uniref:hypothetical protein n=1 Tax=Streptomyces luteireticuli TaxID=173858 RepID=UPI003558AD25
MARMSRACAVVLAGIGLTGGMLTASPAVAAETVKCADGGVNSKEFTLPGKKPATAVHAGVCTKVAAGKVRASVGLTWQILDDQVLDKGKRWDSFTVQVRLKARPAKNGADTVVVQKSCDLTAKLNANWTNAVEEDATCEVPAQAMKSGQWYSADATVIFDVTGDAKGPAKWEMVGSPFTAV